MAKKKAIAKKAAASNSCDWDNSKLACVYTWSFLRALNQYDNTFSTAGRLKMSSLRFWNSLASPDLRKTEARMLAAKLDRIFVVPLKATYKGNYIYQRAVSAMTDVMMDKDKTLCELSEAVNKTYKFAN